MKRLLLLLLLATPLWAQYPSISTITVSGPSVNLTTGNSNKSYQITLTGSVFYQVIDTGALGTELYMNICQDSVGGHTWSWASQFQNAPNVLLAALACTPVTFLNIGPGQWQNESVGNGVGTAASYTGLVDGRDFLISDAQHGQIITDASWSNSSHTINSAGMAQWTSAIIGDRVWGTQGCRTGINSLNTIGVTLPIGTVTAVPSSTQITVSSTTTAAQASAGCVFIGLLQDVAMTSISNVVAGNTSTCPKVHLPAGIFLISAIPGFLNSQPTACANSPIVEGQEVGGAGGMEVRGEGSGATVIVIDPSFTPGSPNCVSGVSGFACFAMPGGAQWKDFRITGMGNAMNGRSDSKYGIELDGYCGLFNVITDMWGTGDTNFYGWDLNPTACQVTDSLLDAFGYNGVKDESTTSSTWRNTVIQNVCGSFLINHTGGGLLQSLGRLSVQFPNASLCSTAINRTALNMNPGIYIGYGDIFDMEGTGTTSSVAVNVASGARVETIGHTQIICAGTNSTCVTNSGTFEMGQGSFIQKTSGAGTTFSAGGGTFTVDMGGLACSGWNVGGLGTISMSGTWLTQGCLGNQLSTGNVGLTSGWGTSSVASTRAGSDGRQGSFTITGAAGSAGPTLTLTFPIAYPVAPASCVLFETGANDLASLTSVSSGTPSTTSVVFTFVGTPVATTYVFDYKCGPG